MGHANVMMDILGISVSVSVLPYPGFHAKKLCLMILKDLWGRLQGEDTHCKYFSHNHYTLSRNNFSVILESCFLSASSSLASLARASSNSADVTEDTVVVEVVEVVVVGIPQLSFALRSYWFLSVS